MDGSWIPGHSAVTFTHSKTPLVLPTKTGPARTLSELVKDITPPCHLNPALFNGHLQTAYTSFNSNAPHIHYKRRVFNAEDPCFEGTFTIDIVVAKAKWTTNEEDPVGVGDNGLPPRTAYWTDKEWEGVASDDNKPLLITLHGLSGGSYESYLRHVLYPLIKETATCRKPGGFSGGDWEALVVNSRGCAGSRITSGILYNARATWDCRQIVKWARKTWPNRPLFGIGFSLGANMMTTYCGEEGPDCLLSAAVVVSNPWKLEVSSLALQRTYLGLEVYSRTMGTSMKKLFEIHRAEILALSNIDLEAVQKIRYLYEFDREVQCATWGYPTEGAYYRDATSADAVEAIRMPFLAINAEDDPIAVKEAMPWEEMKQNPYTVMVSTSLGGHLGSFELSGERWFAKPAAGFLRKMADEVDCDKIICPVEKPGEGKGRGHTTPFVFQPMRRKLIVENSKLYQ